MLKALVIIVAIGFGLKYGIGFLISEDFQKYGDERNAQWTCYVNNIMGNLNLVLSRYREAYHLFEKSAQRCPENSAGEEGAFKMAESLVGMGFRGEGLRQYEKFAEDFKGTKRARSALKSAEILKN